MVPHLPRALQDSNPAVRSWAGHAVLSSVPPDAFEPLLELLATNRSPSLRLLALREYRRRADADAIEAACLDGNANVRFYARRYLGKLRGHVDHRARALTVLQDPCADAAALIGALAALSESGRAEDRTLVAVFTTDPRVKVAAEAVRTLRFLAS